MPELARFHGISIHLFYADTPGHHAPHIHVNYGGRKASVRITDGSVIVGRLPRRQARRVRRFVDDNADVLALMWALAVERREFMHLASRLIVPS